MECFPLEMMGEIRKHLDTETRIRFRCINKQFHKLEFNYYIALNKKMLPKQWNITWFEKYVTIGPWMKDLIHHSRRVEEFNHERLILLSRSSYGIFGSIEYKLTWSVTEQLWIVLKFIGHPYDDTYKFTYAKEETSKVLSLLKK